MTQNTMEMSAPLWLDIKTEYIDDNLDRVISYLYEAQMGKIQKDSFYQKTIDLLEKRISLLLDELQGKDLGDETDDKEDLEMHVRLLGAYLLVHKKEDALHRHAYTAFLSRLLSLHPNHAMELTGIALDNLTGLTRLDEYPFAWSDILSLSPEVLIHKILGNQQYHSEAQVHSWIEQRGCVHIHKGEIGLFIGKRLSLSMDNMVSSMELFDGRIRCYTPKCDKLKKCECDDIGLMEQFTLNYLQQLQTLSAVEHLRTYCKGDTLEVEVEKMQGGNVYLVSVDEKYEPLRGTLLPSPVLGLKKSDFIKYLHVGDHLEVTVQNLENRFFDVTRPLREFIFNEVALPGTMARGKIRSITHLGSIQSARLICEDGYEVSANFEGNYRIGEFVEVEISDVDHQRLVINGNITSCIENWRFTEEDAKRNFIRNFLFAPDDHEEETEAQVNAGELKEIGRMLVASQKSYAHSADRYRVLCILQIVCSMLGWETDERYLALIADYLENLVRFVKGRYDEIRPLSVPEEFMDRPSMRRRARIISILDAYDKQGRDEFLISEAENEDALIRKLAVLVQSSNSIGSFINKSMLNVIKREIISALSLDDDGDTNFDIENGFYLGLESAHQEFKSSFFVAPQGAKEQNQRLTIFKGVCAFLNSRNGGTLYIGVDDLGYVKGIADDLQYLQKNVLGNYFGIDGYIRYITDEAKKYFDLSILTHVNIVPMYDDQVIALEVRPCEFEIVRLLDRAYIRLNNESVVMTEEVKNKILSERASRSLGENQNLLQISNAIVEKRKVVFHQYSSSNGGDIRDRHVEPFSLSAITDTVTCFDLDDQKCKVFKVGRIASVQILQERWSHESEHAELHLDLFRMSGTVPIHVRLQLNLMARNILIDEYRNASEVLCPTSHPDAWILDTDVYRIEGIGRFYLGLAHCIKILDAPELEKYARDYAATYLKD